MVRSWANKERCHLHILIKYSRPTALMFYAMKTYFSSSRISIYRSAHQPFDLLYTPTYINNECTLSIPSVPRQVPIIMRAIFRKIQYWTSWAFTTTMFVFSSLLFSPPPPPQPAPLLTWIRQHEEENHPQREEGNDFQVCHFPKQPRSAPNPMKALTRLGHLLLVLLRTQPLASCAASCSLATSNVQPPPTTWTQSNKSRWLLS